jgi:hypothetical protein
MLPRIKSTALLQRAIRPVSLIEIGIIGGRYLLTLAFLLRQTGCRSAVKGPLHKIHGSLQIPGLLHAFLVRREQPGTRRGGICSGDLLPVR